MALDKSIFYNSDYIVIEYRDLLKSPEFVLLQQIQKIIQNPKLYKTNPLNEHIKTYDIDDLDINALAEWYMNRKYQNILKSLFIDENALSDEEFDNFLVQQLNTSNRFFTDSPPLPLLARLSSLKSLRMVNDILIFAPFNIDYIKDDIYRLTKLNFTYLSSFEEAAEIAKSNSTYFISNIKNIFKLKEMGYLKFSSITLPLEYRYNKKNMYDFDIDFDAEFKENPFKLSYLQAITINRDDENIPDF